ncbi:MAG TPA: TetR/AcrR family transcriptional regulator [Myxococcota bacterium]|nr:TetR/AcrR family transcriptional regulator [Myxococcota bacterium]
MRNHLLDDRRREDTPAVPNGGAATTRSRVFDAAKGALAEKGLEVDIHEVIARAGVGAGTVYRHFANKEALYRAVALEMVDRTRNEFLEIASKYTDARECIARTMELGFRNLRDYGQLAIELFGGVHPPEYGDLFERPALEAFFRALIERGIHQGHFREDVDVEHAVGVWFALTAPGVLGRLLKTRTVEAIAADTTTFFLAGLSGD